MYKNINTLLKIAALAVNSCATYTPQYVDDNFPVTLPDKEIEKSFYLIGDAGNSDLGKASNTLKVFKEELSTASENSTALFLGDNIYPVGLVNKNDKNYELAKHRLEIQIDAVKDYKGKPIFIAGNHDWYSGLNGLKAQEKIIQKALGKKSFLPEAGCPIDKIHISDDIELIIIDSHWYLTNWDKHPNINKYKWSTWW